MNNFQLYRTNLLLGGQMKWNLIIDSASTNLYVADFHLAPISNNIPYTYKTDDTLLNNKHQDNVKSFYKSIEGNFYNEGLNPEFTHNYPVICNSADVIDSYSNTYDMGCRRLPYYQSYKKQFEFLCPVWIEKLTGNLAFKISVKGINSDTVLASNTLTLKLRKNEYHDKFVNYFNNYIMDAGLADGCDDVLNIKFNTNTAVVTGLNASTGIFETRYVDSIVDDLTACERPLMETDSILVQSFVNNSLICKQLFNFNLCFNADDILSGAISDMMLGRELIVSVDVLMNGELLEKKDFYTEYNHIDRYVFSNDLLTKEERNENVLDYLHDYDAINLVDKNKLCQNICHWSLHDNNDYIFNLYEGFSGLYVYKYIDTNGKDAKGYYEIEHQYKNAPNTLIKTADVSQNSTGWINSKPVTIWNDFYKYIVNTEMYKKDGVFIDKNVRYINNLKYAYTPQIQLGFYLLGLNVSSDIMAAILDSPEFDVIEVYSKDNLSLSGLYYLRCIEKDGKDLILLLTTTNDYLAFGNFYDILHNYSLTDFSMIEDEVCRVYLSHMHKLMKSKIEPEIITLGSGILWGTAAGPDVNITEVEYYKDNSTLRYVTRYDGKIKPTFVDKKNTLYYKDYIVNGNMLKNSKYAKYNTLGYEPLYPSIDYFAIKPIIKWDYDTCPTVKVSAHTDEVSIYNSVEYPWFNHGVSIILKPEIRFEYINRKKKDGSYDDFDLILYACIAKYYNITDDKTIRYILSKYTVTNDWEYFSNTNVDDYIYNMTFTLI